ncbi:MAG: flavodoxin family protein [Candidatus Bathyarchaeota archaeon]|jgi:flavodoxin
MRVLVAYTSRTGNTKKVAEAIYEEIEEEKAIKEFDNITNLDDYDLIFVGFPIENFGPCEKARTFLKSFCVGKTIVLFITHAAPEYLPAVLGWLVKCIEAASESNVAAVFNCKGELAEDVRQSMLKSPNPMIRAWAEKSIMSKGQPDTTRIERTRLFVKELLKK